MASQNKSDDQKRILGLIDWFESENDKRISCDRPVKHLEREISILREKIRLMQEKLSSECISTEV